MKRLLFFLLFLASCTKEKMTPKPCTGNQCKMYPRLEEPVRRVDSAACQYISCCDAMNPRSPIKLCAGYF